MECSPHERDLLTVRAVTGRPGHGVRFIDGCGCGRQLDFSGRLSHCPCGVRLATVRPAEWTDADRAVSTYIEARLHGAGHPRVPRLDRLDLSEAIALCAWVGELQLGERQVERYDAVYGIGFAALSGPRSALMGVVQRRAGARWIQGAGRVGEGRLQPELPGLMTGRHGAVADLVREAAAWGVPQTVAAIPKPADKIVQRPLFRRRSSLVPRPEYIPQILPGQRGASVHLSACR